MEDMEGNYIGACSDVYTFEMQSYIRDLLRCPEEGYFNSGVLMFNIPLWIKENLVEKCVKKIADMPDLSYPDQDVLNMVCAGKISTLMSCGTRCGMLSWEKLLFILR